MQYFYALDVYNTFSHNKYTLFADIPAVISATYDAGATRSRCVSPIILSVVR